jgi:hypothetical protein
MQVIAVHDYSLMVAFGKELKTSCIIKPRTKGMTTAYSENADGSQGIPYQPVQFPKGLWAITEVMATTNPLMAPFFIATTARQLITGLDGKTTAVDWGYGIHFDVQFEDTWGCLHLYSADDAQWLAAEINAAGLPNVQLQVL